MQERALHIGARLTLSSEPSGGTEVRLDVPLPEGPP
jgi:signal transduction histidine kinase